MKGDCELGLLKMSEISTFLVAWLLILCNSSRDFLEITHNVNSFVLEVILGKYGLY